MQPDSDRPACVDCGSRHGPWVPIDGRAPNDAQLFRCAPGHGCQA